MEKMIHLSIKNKQPYALMLMDIDNFKQVNDFLGYATSDLLITEVENRLKTVIRQGDQVIRLGGDEFAIIFHQIESKETLMPIAEAILALFSEPFQISGKEITTTMSIGVCFYPADTEDANKILNYADTAMYQAKKMGRNNIQFYLAGMSLQSTARVQIDIALRKAIQRDELELYYQPQVDLTNQRLIGAEALLRWHHPTLGMLTPDKFISLAEETGQIIEIGAWVLNTAFKAAVVWNAGDIAPIQIAVNLSTLQFVRNDLVMTIKNLLAETGCKPEWIKMEITESILLDKSPEMFGKLISISELGFDISIDDFGTGYSALSYLTNFPISQIKIDRSFISDIPIDLEKTAIVKIIIQLASILHFDLVAEGVETEEQAEYLKTYGCTNAQGYLFGKPMPHSKFDLMLQASRQQTASQF